MSTPAPLRVALAGLGSMGRNHLRVISTHAETQLVAVKEDAFTLTDAPPPAPSPSGWAGTGSVSSATPATSRRHGRG